MNLIKMLIYYAQSVFLYVLLELDSAYLSFLRKKKMFGQLFANSFFLLFGGLAFVSPSV